MGLTNSSQKKIRDKAAQAFNEILEKHVDVAENELNAVLQNKKIMDSLRNFTRADSSRHMADDMDTEVVDALTKAVTKRFSISQDYYKLKAKLLGVSKLEYHERNVPIGKLDKKYTYEEAYQLVMNVFQKLDNEFAMIFSTFQEQGQIDVSPKKGKHGGAFATTMTLKTPTYILLNHNDDLDNVTTLAHELGHGINNELIRAKQNELNFGTPTSTAEVASTFMEDFVLQELEREADDELRLSLMMMKLNDDISTIFRQIAFYNFEKELHAEFRAKGYLSKEEIGTLFQKHMMSFMGTAVEQSKGSENWWIYVSHFRYFFYVYSYAGGLLISKSLQASVKKDPTFITEVKEFLGAGMTDSPKNIFKKLQIDITKPSFWDEGLDEIEGLLSEATKLATKLKKI
jgi:oligoendopeptidase F